MKEVELDSVGLISTLLSIVREMWGREVVPVGRVGCGECGKVEELVGM